MIKKQFNTVIEAGNKSFGSKTKEVLQYRDLIVTFVKRNFVTIYKQTVLGPAWILIAPLMTSVIFTFVFGQLAGISTDGVPQVLFYFAGNSLWAFFSSSFSGTANTFVNNASIFGKVYFPRLTVPISQVITSLINFFIQIAMFFVLYVYFLVTGSPIHFTWAMLYVPVMLLQLGVLALSSGIIVSSLTTKYRDLAIAVTFGVQLWMYISPVVYPISILGGITKLVVLINPVSMPLELFRIATMGTGTFVPWSFALSWAITILTAWVGLRLFHRIENTFMDTI